MPAPTSPKVAADADREPDRAGIERYEELRRQAVDGGEAGWRLGLALLEHRGVAAWLRAWRSVVVPQPLRPVQRWTGAGDEVVGVLTSMALACIRGR